MNKLGNKNIIKKMFGNKEVLKEVLNGSVIYSAEEELLPYVMFSSPTSMTISKSSYGQNDGTMEYSLDGENWSSWDYSEVSGTTIYFRGTGNTYVKGTLTYHNFSYFSITGTNISVSGNINALLDYQTTYTDLTSVASNTFQALFSELTNLIDASNLKLPATILNSNCYSYMFFHCIALAAVPALPATTLASNCYYYMFNYCRSLTSAPALPATTLADSCYNSMFQGCEALITVPALPATTLANKCYQGMFYSCYNLETLPALPATTLTDYCYNAMFSDCSKIKISKTQTGEYQIPYRIPTIGNGTSGTNSLGNMFASTGGSSILPTVNTTYYTSNTIV